MSGDYKETKRGSLISSFSYATKGIIYAVIHERNMKIHIFSGLLVIAFSLYFQIRVYEWVIVILLIGGMLALEMVNTAIEQLVNLVTREVHPVAKIVKDVAAGAVFVYALTTVIIGLIIFIPYLVQLIS